MKQKSRQSVWSEYWSNTSIQSCDEAVKSQSSDINKFWDKCSFDLKETDKVLDLCSGKGAVISTLIGRQLEKKGYCSHYTGVDIADLIESDLLENLRKNKDKVNFLFNTSIDDIPLEDRTFDVVTSQFGIEYQLSDISLSEIFRILKEDGRGEFVIHHSDSVMIETARKELKYIELLLNENGYLQSVRKLIPFYAMLKNPANLIKLKKNNTALEAKDAFNHQSNEIINIISQNDSPGVLQTTLEVSKYVLQVAKENGTSKAKEILKKFENELLDSRLRSIELISSAFDKAKLNQFEIMLKKYRRSIKQADILYSNGVIVAWGVVIN